MKHLTKNVLNCLPILLPVSDFLYPNFSSQRPPQKLLTYSDCANLRHPSTKSIQQVNADLRAGSRSLSFPSTCGCCVSGVRYRVYCYPQAPARCLYKFAPQSLSTTLKYGDQLAVVTRALCRPIYKSYYEY